MPAHFWIALSIVIPGFLLITAVVNSYRERKSPTRREGF